MSLVYTLKKLSSSDKKILISSIANKDSFIAINRNKFAKLDIEDLFVLQNLNRPKNSTETENSNKKQHENKS